METKLVVQQEIEKVSDQLSTLQTEGDELAFLAETVVVHNLETLAEGKELLIQASGINKKIAAIIKPVKAAFKNLVDSYVIGIQAAEKILRGKINEYAQEQERQRREAEAKLLEQQRQAAEEARLAAEKAAANNQPAPPPPPPPLPVHLDSPTDDGFRTYWKWRIEDAEMIPEKYWTVQLNDGLITKEVSEQKENFSVPGIKTFTEKKVVAR